MIVLGFSLYTTNFAYSSYGRREPPELDKCWNLADGQLHMPEDVDDQWSSAFQLTRIVTGSAAARYHIVIAGVTDAPWRGWKMCRIALEWDSMFGGWQPAVFYAGAPTDIPSGMAHYSFAWGDKDIPGPQMILTVRREV